MTRPSIALTLIAKNEIKNIDRLAASIEGCFDKVIFVDTGSTDGTVERAKELGFQVEHFEWIQDFSAARNYALSFVDTDYWAWLDLDDSLQSKEAFIKWRNEVMLLADIWLVNYHYTTDPEGRPLCMFLRERIMKTSVGAKWVFPIHEGIVPPGASNCQFTNSFHVRHHRTEEDLKNDKGRNLKVFERMLKEGQKLEPRMQYYYGKELFEAKRPVEAQEWLLKAASADVIEYHDRILAIQYACYALMSCSQTEKALSIAFQGISIAPKRAELYCIIADCYMKMNKFEEALPFLSAAENCTINNGPSVIFTDHASYGMWPKNQRAKLYFHMQKFDEAESLIIETLEKYPNAESEAMLKEIQKVKYYTVAYKTAKPCEDIAITCIPGPYKWDSKIYAEKAMGGSETAAIEMSKWLTRLTKRKVIIFNEREDIYVDEDKVEYRPIAQINEYMAAHKPWVHVAWRHNLKCTDAPTYLWSHDLTTPGAEVTKHYDELMALTPFHKGYLKSAQGVPPEKIWTTRNGIVPERFQDALSIEKDPWMFVFSSSPDRGLDRAIFVLDNVRKLYPDIKLHVYYGIENLPKYGLQALHDKLKTMMEERPWIIYHGATQQDVMIADFKKAAFCVQPSDFIETSKITAVEMLLCGVYQITRGVGGCVDTLREAEAQNMCKMIYSDCKTPEQFKIYENAVIHAIQEESYKNIKDLDPSKYSWENIAREWISHFNDRMKT